MVAAYNSLIPTKKFILIAANNTKWCFRCHFTCFTFCSLGSPVTRNFCAWSILAVCWSMPNSKHFKIDYINRLYACQLNDEKWPSVKCVQSVYWNPFGFFASSDLFVLANFASFIVWWIQIKSGAQHINSDRLHNKCEYISLGQNNTQRAHKKVSCCINKDIINSNLHFKRQRFLEIRFKIESYERERERKARQNGQNNRNVLIWKCVVMLILMLMLMLI